jgi:hypothetical protein
MNYSIHDIVTFRLISEKSNSVIKKLRDEYANFETTHVSNPDFVVYLGGFSPSQENCSILDNDYYLKKDYLYCKDSYQRAKWKFEISGFENEKTKIHLSTNFFGSMVISGFLIDPIIGMKLAEKGYSMVHGSSVGKGKKAYIFTSQGGGGKTSIALNSVERGFKFLGDNFVILDKDSVLGFLSPLNIFSFNLVPIVKKNMRTKKRIEFHIKNYLYKVSGLRLVTKINPMHLFPQSTDDKAAVNSIFMLSPKNKFNVTKITKEKLVKHIILNQILDSIPFIKYMMMYSYLFPNSKIADCWNLYERNLQRNIGDNISIYEVETPQKYDKSIFEKILEEVPRLYTK